MINETMTIHTALREIRTIDMKLAKITGELQNATAVVNGLSTKIGSETLAEWAARKKELYQSFKANVNRRRAIKMAIAEKNATTYITIKSYSDKPITVAAAIDLLKGGFDDTDNLMDRLKQNYSAATRAVEGENRDVAKRADASVIQMFGKDKEGATSSVDAIAWRENYIKKQNCEILDPLDIPNLVMREQERIEDARAEIDAALSVSNATTMIDIEYDNG